MPQDKNSEKALLKVIETLELTNESGNDLFRILSNYLNELIEKDFQSLVNILYRVDVSEKKVRESLANTGNQNAGDVLAQLLIEREIEKNYWRERYKKGLL
jgi:hypothetical protein